MRWLGGFKMDQRERNMFRYVWGVVRRGTRSIRKVVVGLSLQKRFRKVIGVGW
jgi:hypothetical protein